MKNKQAGFIGIILIIIAALAVIGVGRYAATHYGGRTKTAVSETSTTSEETKTDSNNVNVKATTSVAINSNIELMIFKNDQIEFQYPSDYVVTKNSTYLLGTNLLTEIELSNKSGKIVVSNRPTGYFDGLDNPVITNEFVVSKNGDKRRISYGNEGKYNIVVAETNIKDFYIVSDLSNKTGIEVENAKFDLKIVTESLIQVK